MARMIPHVVDPNAIQSEKDVFAELERQLPASWTVLHGKRFVIPAAGRRPPVEGEVDFIVLDPNRGYIGIEVKGGGVERDAEGWFRRTPNGVRRIGDPGHQAQKNVHGIAEYLNGQPVFRGLGRGPKYGWGVCLPYYDVAGSLGSELPEEFVIDKTDMRDLPKAMDRLFAANKVDGPPLIEGIPQAWLGALAPVFSFSVSLASRVADSDARIFRLTEEQKALLDNFSEIRRVGVKGGAGTGKTVLAMELAERWVAQGKRVLFLCYNKPLADEITAKARGFSVQTFHGLCSSMAKSAGEKFSPSRGEGDREFWEEEAPDQLSRVLDVLADERFDAVVVDEGQDFKGLWWLAIEKLLRNENESCLWAFYDPNQDLYGGGPTEALDLTPAVLRWNCRNTGLIAEYSSSMIGSEAQVKEGAPKGVQVEEIECANEARVLDEVRKAVHRLVVDEQLSPKDVVILSPLASASPVWRAKKLGNLELVDFPDPVGANQVRFSSLQRFKGLEAKAIVLCDVDQKNPLCSPMHLYVGTSRAQSVLIVISHASG